jgi:hypothetical protein
MKEIRSKNGEVFTIISKGKPLSTMAKLRESVEIKTFIDMILEDTDVLNLLCTHRSILSMFERFNFPLLFTINLRGKEKLELPFALVATKESKRQVR